jgi:hypothetical protein
VQAALDVAGARLRDARQPHDRREYLRDPLALVGCGHVPLESRRPLRQRVAVGRRPAYHVESEGYHYGDITWTCSGTPRPSVDGLYAGWFDFAGSLYTSGSEFGPDVHTETVRDDGTLAGLHSPGDGGNGADSGSTARVEWSLHAAE